MASTVKIPIALKLLECVDRGECDLGDTVPRYLRAEFQTLASPASSAQLRLLDLLELMLVESNNVASDIVLEVAGGLQAVRAHLAALGSTEISVDRSIHQLLADCYALGEGQDAYKGYVSWSTRGSAAELARRRHAVSKFLEDPRDTATAWGLVRLLSVIAKGEALSQANTRVLVDIMTRCATGKERLTGMIPESVQVAHKTGTIKAVIDDGPFRPYVSADMGVIYLPEGRGRIAVAATIVGSHLHQRQQDRCIARIGRLFYDHFIATVPGHGAT